MEKNVGIEVALIEYESRRREQTARIVLTNRTKPPDAILNEVRAQTLKAYETQTSAYYSTSELWDDGILDPVDTRNALGMAISASLNAPLGDKGYGVFRM